MKVIGDGPVGDTAEGLELARETILDQLSFGSEGDVSVEVPEFVVICAGVFDAFLGRNHLDPDDLVALSDRQLARCFQGAELPRGLAEDLQEVASELDGPLVVRASSVLEAASERSFVGAFPAKLIPNRGSDLERRRQQLADAVRFIWASTYAADAVSWRRGAGQSLSSERMAVVVQRAVGSVHGERFYPTVSVVARSYNHYPVPGNEPDEGVVTLALGFGKIIAEGHTWSYSPARPTAPPPFKSTGDMLKHSQTSFWALDLSDNPSPDPNREAEYLVRLGLGDAEQDGTLDLLASTYDPQSDRVHEGLDGRGPRVLTFAPLLRSHDIPFTSVIRETVNRARTAMGREVRIEMAVTLGPDGGTPTRFSIVLLKTMAGPAAGESVDAADLAGDAVLVPSDACLGNGTRVDLDDVVYLKPAAFDRSQTRTATAELDAVNRGLLEEGRQAVFIGFGRWGTTDERYGLPVRWGQISTAQVIVEVALPDAPLNVSHGTHFFHHLLSQRVLYFNLEHGGSHEVDFAWLDEQEAVWEGRYVRHVRLDAPLEVRVDGTSRRGVIRKV